MAVIGTGHQAIWHHCGIWAKTLVASRFASAIQAVHLHLIVDHDVCDTALVVPTQTTHGHWTTHRREIEVSQRGIPLEMRDSPPAGRIHEFVRAVVQQNTASACAAVWADAVFDERGSRRFRTVSDLITCLHTRIDAHFAVAPALYLPVSELSLSKAFTRFAVFLMADAVRFADVYNEAVFAHSRAGNRGPRIIRYLTVDKESHRVELPFWLIGPDGRRRPLHVTQQGTEAIHVDMIGRRLGTLDSSPDDRADQLTGLLERHNCRLRPRAVTLTLFARMTLVDWFVHGVGGHAYETIGDYLFQHYFGRRPPHVALATCTMVLPEDVPAMDASGHDTIPDLKRELHSLTCNPERYISEPTAHGEPVAALVQRKRAAVNDANDRRLPHDRRKSAWMEIQRVNQDLLPYAGSEAHRLQQRLMQAEQRDRSEEARIHREYFFGLFPERRLRTLAESIPCGQFLTGEHEAAPTDLTSVNRPDSSPGPAEGRCQ